jgi:molybdopterin converting factor small subunit
MTPAPIRVVIETISYISDMVDRPGQTQVLFEESATPQDTVRSVLRKFSIKHAKLNEALWDPNNRTEIGSHVEVIVNDAILDIHHTLDSHLHDGDRITLTGQYIGG